MKKPIALWVAPPLLLVKSAACVYVGFVVAVAPRYRIGMMGLAVVFAGLAVLLFYRPRVGRWPVGAYYFLAMWLGVGAAVKPDAPPKEAALAWVSTALGCWLAYALLGSKKTKAYLDNPSTPNQSSEPTAMSVTPPAAQEPRQP